MKFVGILLCAFLLGAQGQSFEVAEASIADLQKAMTEGKATSASLVRAYLGRIAAFDQAGPRLNSLILINPNAVSEAEALDRERATKGVRGPLHGVPVIVKDNYSTRDMQTTAGTLALMGFVPSIDAFQVKKLREAGAVILGKSNLHELASGITTVGSAFGNTRNPYDPARNPGGSSGGTGAAVAASLAAVGMGSDTCGSIRIPASFNNLVGLRPTKGLSSIAGIVPLSVTQDTGGPLARTVSDLAVVLDATIGEDAADAATKLEAGQVRPKFMNALVPGALKAARIGVLEPLFGDASDDRDVIRLVRTAIEDLGKQGAVAVPVAMPELTAALDGSTVIALEMAEDLAQYFATSGNPPVHSLEEIVNGGLLHTQLDTLLRTRAASKKGRSSREYQIALAKRAALRQMILKLMEDEKLDALVYPTIRRKPARLNDPQLGSTCQLSAATGFPAITVPAGFTPDGLPVGVELLARPLEDAKLVSFAYGYEQATHHRRAPLRTPALGSVAKPIMVRWENTAVQPNGAGTITAQMQLEPSTGELGYRIALKGFPAGEVIAATLHRKSTEANGPIHSVLANHAFSTLEGTVTLSDPERVLLREGGFYLRLALKAQAGASLRLVIQPPQ